MNRKPSIKGTIFFSIIIIFGIAAYPLVLAGAAFIFMMILLRSDSTHLKGDTRPLVAIWAIALVLLIPWFAYILPLLELIQANL